VLENDGKSCESQASAQVHCREVQPGGERATRALSSVRHSLEGAHDNGTP
jgi:hypothetical protein